MTLEPVAETCADPNSYGFRKGRSTADAVEQCFKFLSKSDAPEWILEGDIKGCFDHISHRWLLTHVPMNAVTLEKWLQCGFLENSKKFATEEGTPQGGITTPLTQKVISTVSPARRQIAALRRALLRD